MAQSDLSLIKFAMQPIYLIQLHSKSIMICFRRIGMNSGPEHRDPGTKDPQGPTGNHQFVE